MRLRNLSIVSLVFIPTPALATTYVCEACPAGTWGDGTNCNKCSTGTYAYAGASSCSTCSAGTYSGVGAGSCSTCLAGTYSNAGAGSCTSCPAGKYSTGGASSCTNCLTIGVKSCDSKTGKATSCNSGYKFNSAGVCIACDAGTWSTAGSTSCKSCLSEGVEACSSTTGKATKCKAGYGLYNGVCKICDVGTYSAGGSGVCLTCNTASEGSWRHEYSYKECVRHENLTGLISGHVYSSKCIDYETRYDTEYNPECGDVEKRVTTYCTVKGSTSATSNYSYSTKTGNLGTNCPDNGTCYHGKCHTCGVGESFSDGNCYSCPSLSSDGSEGKYTKKNSCFKVYAVCRCSDGSSHSDGAYNGCSSWESQTYDSYTGTYSGTTCYQSWE